MAKAWWRSQRHGDGFAGLGGHSSYQESWEVFHRAHGSSAPPPSLKLKSKLEVFLDIQYSLLSVVAQQSRCSITISTLFKKKSNKIKKTFFHIKNCSHFIEIFKGIYSPVSEPIHTGSLETFIWSILWKIFLFFLV